MEPALIVAGLWILFGGTHVGLAAARDRIVARLGEIGFAALYNLVAAVTFALLVTYYAAHRFDGAAGLALGHIALLRWLLVGVVTLGIVLMSASLLDYPRMPTAVFNQPIKGARGIERITRHPFFMGTALLGGAHVLLATHLTGMVFFGGLMVLSVLGPMHQDRKLTARRGRAYTEYRASTSLVPFAAIIAGRQTLPRNELPVRGVVIGLVLALAARYGHDHLFADGGLWIIVGVLGGAALAAFGAYRHAHRRGPRVGPLASPESLR